MSLEQLSQDYADVQYDWLGHDFAYGSADALSAVCHNYISASPTACPLHG